MQGSLDHPALTLGSLFTGLGGMDMGLEWAGMKVAWQCESEPFCRRQLAIDWPGVDCLEDVSIVGATTVCRVDVLAGGFPCQDIADRGYRRGIVEGSRSGLWFEYARIIRELRPRYVVVENVASLLALGMDIVLGSLAESGYDAEWDCIPASAVGAPHERDRLFVVAYADSERLEGKRIFDTAPSARRQPADESEAARRSATWWAVEPDVGRMAYGVREHRAWITALGNAVVPHVAQYVGECVVRHAAAVERERARRRHADAVHRRVRRVSW